VPPAPTIPTVPFDVKMAWMLRLEDARMLRDPLPPPVEVIPAPPLVPSAAPVAPLAVVEGPTPDLVRLLEDTDARVRRRASLAAGRVGHPDAVDPLAARLTDDDPEVRQAAAFALGLLGDRRARDPLVAALDDGSALVQTSAVEALGLIGDPDAAPAIARLAAGILQSGALVTVPDEREAARRDTPAAVYRQALGALVRLRAFDALATAALDASGLPRLSWWPVAFALQRIEDPRARPALVTLLGDTHPYTRAFAVKGLGGLRDRAAVPLLVPLLGDKDGSIAIEAARALARIGDRAAAPALASLVTSPDTAAALRLEAVTALADLADPATMDLFVDRLGDPSPPIRAAAIRALAAIAPQDFVFILSGLDPDPHWTVRAALATALGTLRPDAGLPRLRVMLGDEDQRVIPAVLAALARLAPPDAGALLIDHLRADDMVVRQAAAVSLATLRPPEGAAALAEAYRFGERDLSYVARAAALTALTAYGAEAAAPTLTAALEDREWAVRLRAADLLRELGSTVETVAAIRPAPVRHAPEFYATPRLINPPVATQAFIDTNYGSIQIELAVIDAPLTVDNFVTLARRGFYDGLLFHRVVPNFVVQAGDPRGDGEGGPGFTIRDELSELPYLRGAVGMALDWKDTGGSQFFITLTPQPHLDARYTVFARVVAGMEVVDQIRLGDTIHRIRIWDGTMPQ
jgi:HEAT repeat protein/cyclophilin family peptidyl-prolyl cis-trans isomerase